MDKVFSLGIDLGTSNSAAAMSSEGEDSPSICENTQILGSNLVGAHRTLASALYIPHSTEFAAGAIQLPWSRDSEDQIIGNFARDHGAQVPERLVTSAKSWLCNPHIDRKAATLPWNSTITETRLSPFETSQRLLRHVKESVCYSASRENPDWNWESGHIILTVPASFDEVARSLTHEAAEEAGLGGVTLLEEPQAAFYAWLAHCGNSWRGRVGAGDSVLVCDVGGGTADFSLISVSEEAGALTLERISVGEHILLGGDNMDLALAYVVRSQLETDGKSLDAWQFLSLIHGARSAKERLFADPFLQDAPIAIPSRGSGLFAGAITTRLSRDTLQQITVEGFLPLTSISDQPAERTSVGLQEFGLAYESDPVLSKHLARFLTRSLTNVRSNPGLYKRLSPHFNDDDTFLRPTAVLFNGGVFDAAPLRERVLQLLGSWSDGRPVRELESAQRDLAVARGAAYYGASQLSGEGIRIKAGTARSYYIGLEASMPAIPGFKPPVKALCVVPQGMEEGSETRLASQEFGLLTGQTVGFRFFSSSVRAGDKVGHVLDDAERDLKETSRLEINLPPLEGRPPGDVVPVHLQGLVTELGTLELWMHHTRSNQKWKVEFKVRTE